MLEGRLDDFSLPDVFQLLALTGKTGTLRLRYADTAGAVIFRDGRVVGAFDDVRRTAPGTRMFASGLIDESQLEAAIAASEAGAEGGVVGALVAAGAVDEDTVAEFRRQQAEDAVFALMRLSEATFSIEAGEVAPLPGEVELNTEQLIVEGGRRLGEWTEIRRRVPGRQSVPALVPDPPGEGPVTVGRDQWRLMALIDGRRTVADLVDLLGTGEYTTSAELSGLVDAGLIAVGDRASHATGARTRGERLREFEARELGLMRDDPGATPEVAAVAPADDDADVGADAGDDGGDDGEAGEAAPSETPARDASRRGMASRSTLQATLISGIELYDDDAEPDATAGDNTAEPDPAAGDDESDPPGADDGGQADAAAADGPGADEPAASDPADVAAGDASQAPPPPGHGPLPAPQGAAPAVAERDRGEEPVEPVAGRVGADGPGPTGDDPHAPAAAGDPAHDGGGGAGAEEPADADGTGAEAAEAAGAGEDEARLTRDEDINKALLLRLIDGVKGV